MNNLLIIVAALAVIITAFAVGAGWGQRLQQNTIVGECKREGVYLDRRLLLQCSVTEPVGQRGSTS